MSGVYEQDLKLRNKINDMLIDKPEYLRGYINFMNDSSTRTKYNYLVIVLRFLSKINKDVTLCNFDDFNNYLADIKYKQNGEEQGKSYQICTYSALKKLCEYLYKSRKIPEFYMLDIRKPKFSESQKTIEKRSVGYLDSKEMKKMVAFSGNNTSSKRELGELWKIRNQAIICLFLSTGMRCSALMSIDYNDMDLDQKTIIVTEKGGKVRRYDLSDEVCLYLRQWIINRPNVDTKALFISNEKNRMSAGAINYVVKSIAKYATKKNISAHKLRATYGTQLYNTTGDIYFVQDCMGHKSPTTTELYVRDKKQNTKRASEIMGKLMK